MDSARLPLPAPPQPPPLPLPEAASASSLQPDDPDKARAAAANPPHVFVPPKGFPEYRHPPKPKTSQLGRAYHFPPPPVVTLAGQLKMGDPMPLPADRMTMHRVGMALTRIQGSIAFPLRERLDTNPGYKNLAAERRQELRELLAVNPQLYNHAKYYTWTSRHVREMVDDIKLAVGSSAKVRYKVDKVMQASKQRDPAMRGVVFPKPVDLLDQDAAGL